MGQHAQLDLAVVRGKDQPVLLAWDKGLTDLTTLFQTNRDILQVRVSARQTTRLGQRLIET
ncbi:hypothetical protein HRR73_009600, partial [Exophiala dermatitidis]